MKRLIRSLDKLLLGGALTKGYVKILERCAQKIVTTQQLSLGEVRSKNSHRIDICYTKNAKSELSRLCDFYGSDKGESNSEDNPYPWPSHTYADFYAMLFGHCRQSVKNVLECGVGTNNPDLASSMGVNGKPGASLRVWRDYFPNANIVGIDIDEDILFKEERIKTFLVDQTSPSSIQKFWNSVGVENFDLILDDGLHAFHAGLCLFENSFEHLAANGVYIIEDVSLSNLTKYASYFETHTEKYYCRFVNLYRPNMPLYDNSVLMITKK